MDLAGKRALVTGGAVRLGRAICEALAARGCTVIIHANRSVAAAASLAGLLAAKGCHVFRVQGLLNDEPSAERLITDAIAAAGGVDILVNNASVFHKDAFMDADAGRLRDELAINTFIPIYLTRAFARHLASCDTGRHRNGPDGDDGMPAGKIVNLLDRRVAGLEKGSMPYLLSKKMLCEYTKISALELGPRITVNAVAPGPVLPPPGQGLEYLHDHAGPMVLGRRPAPADVAAAVVYLLEADSVTGQVLFTDSGQHLLSIQPGLI